MHRFKEMDPDEIRAILDATGPDKQKLHQDVLTPLFEKENAVFSAASCPKCGTSGASPILDPHRPFVSSSPLPRRILKCVACQTEFDPRTGLITLANITF